MRLVCVGGGTCVERVYVCSVCTRVVFINTHQRTSEGKIRVLIITYVKFQTERINESQLDKNKQVKISGP
jgi:hypothetical protein